MTAAFSARVMFYGGPRDGGDDMLRIPIPEWLPGAGETRYLCVGHTITADTNALRYEWQYEHTGRRAPCSYHRLDTAPRGCPNRPKADAT